VYQELHLNKTKISFLYKTSIISFEQQPLKNKALQNNMYFVYHLKFQNKLHSHQRLVAILPPHKMSAMVGSNVTTSQTFCFGW
jgi:hypothetical protein